jgi:hypothetical protein
MTGLTLVSRRLDSCLVSADACLASTWCRTLPAPIAISVKSSEDSSFFDEYDDNDGPDIDAGKIRPEQQVLFKDFSG